MKDLGRPCMENEMGKRLLMAVMAIFLVTGLRANDLADDGLHGKVRCVATQAFPLVNRFLGWGRGKPEKGKVYKAYDLPGNWTEWNTYDLDGTLHGRITRTFDGLGREDGSLYYDGDGSLLFRDVVAYTDQGYTVTTLSCDGGERPFSLTTYMVDRLGKILEYWMRIAGNDGACHYFRAYDGEGRLSGSGWYREDGTLVDRDVHSYDDRGRLIESRVYVGDGSLESLTRYAYDGRGNLTGKSVFWGSEVLYERMAYVYRFDRQGNWIARTESRQVESAGKVRFVPQSVTVREISYYP